MSQNIAYLGTISKKSQILINVEYNGIIMFLGIYSHEVSLERQLNVLHGHGTRNSFDFEV